MIKEQDSYEKSYYQHKGRKIIVKNRCRWNCVEQYGYISYLSNFKFIFSSHQERKRIKVFNHMSNVVKTRKPYQIKSHHQKMMMKHNSNIDEIISALRIKIHNLLRGNIEAIEKIKKINQESKEFYHSEMNIENKTSRIYLNKKSQNKDKSSNDTYINLSYLLQDKIMIEEKEENLDYHFIKKQQNSGTLYKYEEIPATKLEQNQDIPILRFC